MDNETNKHRTVRELRAMADYIESRPFDENTPFTAPDIYIFLNTATEFGETVAAAGSVVKSADGNFLNATISFGYSRLKILINQDLVCERIKTGEKVVEAVPEHTVDIFEMKCPESFLALKDNQPTDAKTEELVSS